MALDASDAAAVEALLRAEGCDVLMNAADPRFVMPLFNAAGAAGATYLDMAMSLSKPHPERPYEECGVKLGDEQFAKADQWEAAGRLALVGMGVEPGLSDVFARYAADNLFEAIDEVGVRDGANLAVAGYDFAPTFSIWTTIEECLNPPVIWERDRGWYTTEPFSGAEVFEFPDGIGPVECVNVEHEEVLLIPRWVDCKRVHLQVRAGRRVHRRAAGAPQDRARPHRPGDGARRASVSPRRGGGLPARPGHARRQDDRQDLCGHLSPAPARTAIPLATYLYHVVDNEWSMAEYGSQAVVWQTAVNPVVALELVAAGTWSGAGVLGPEAFDAVPFLDLLTEYGSPWGRRDDPRG